MFASKRFFLICVITSFVFMTQSGCALFSDSDMTQFHAPSPAEKVFRSRYETLWKVIILAMQTPKTYPIRVSNMDAGLIETDSIKGSEVWHSPIETTEKGSGYTYQLKVQIIGGRTRRSKAFKVVVSKHIQLQRDFFSGAKRLKSDGLEEKLLLYRISRELKIDRGIRRAYKKRQRSRANSS